MKKLVYISLFLFVYVVYSQDSDVIDPTNTVNLSFKKYENPKTQTTKQEDQTPPIASRPTITDYAVGSTAGNFAVSLTGAATYNIPIALPPGIKDVAPKIGLSYSSQGGNGLAGWGWNLSGLSSISRIPATKYYDGKHEGVDFKDDRYALDGQRLILKSGTYGADGSVYQTENYSNIKIVAHGTSSYGASYGPAYFEVFYPNGARAYYGDARNSSSKLEWAIYRWQDLKAVSVDYFYEKDNNLLNIHSISFGSRLSSDTPNKIYFDYKKRTRATKNYIGGETFRRTNLLSSISVKTNNKQYRKYVLSHDKTSLDYERLKSVAEYGQSGISLTPIMFNYGSTTTGLKKKTTTKMIPSINYKEDAIVSGEFDGDGRLDFFTYNKKTKKKLQLFTDLFNEKENNTAYEIALEKKFDAVFPTSILSHNGKMLHEQAITTVTETVNSNSRKSSVKISTFAIAASRRKLVHQYDKIWEADAKVYAYSCDSKRYEKIPKQYISGDFNGDGLTDVLAIRKNFTSRNCYKMFCNPDDGITPRRIAPTECCECESGSSAGGLVTFINLDRRKTGNFSNIAGHLKGGIGDKDRLIPADFNGDGKLDLFHFKEGVVYIYTLSDDNKLVLLHTQRNLSFKMDGLISLGDFNGDGKTDILTPTGENSSRWNFFISQGDSIDAHVLDIGMVYHKGGPGWYFYKEYHYVAQDFNGDGKTDIMMQEVTGKNGHYGFKSTIDLYENNLGKDGTAAKFVKKRIELDEHDNGRKAYEVETIPLAFNISLQNSTIDYGYIYQNKMYGLEMSKNHAEDVELKSVYNSGVITTIDYETLGFPSNKDDQPVYTKQYTEAYPYINVNYSSTMRLVKKVTESAEDVRRYQDFKYYGAISNVNVGFIGFSKTKRSNVYGDGVSKLWTISKHSPQLKGAITEQWLSENDYEGSNYISKSTTVYDTNLASNKVFTNLPKKITKHNRLTGTTSTREIVYDGYKNPSSETTTFSGGKKQATYTYSNDVASNNQTYHVGRLIKKIETSTIGSNSFTTEEQYEYYPNDNLLKEQKVKGTGTPWNVESFEYDKFGNITKKTLTPSGMASREESFTYSSDGRFLKTSTDVEGLVTTFTYDNFGNPLTSTNPYGQTTTFAYDVWNRLTSETNYLGKSTTFLYEHIINGRVRHTKKYPQGGTEIKEYNALGWVQKTKALGLNGKWTQKSVEYDVAGRKLRESEPYFNNPGQWNITAYDTYGRVITQTKFTGQVGRVTYSGLTTTVNDGTKTIITTKDGGGNTVKMQDPGGTITYTYHGNGTMKTANYGGHVVRTEIDGWGRKTKLVDPSAGTYTYTYNNLGEITKETTPKGATHYTYDTVGKVMTKKVEGDNTNINLAYAYDNTTKLLKSITGKNTRVNESYSYTYTYDNQKRPSVTKESNGKANFEHKVGYDGFGRIETETYISKSNNITSTVAVNNVYDAATGMLTEIKGSANKSLWKLNEANERGQAKEIALGNGMVKNRTYDNNGLLTNLKDATTASISTIALNVNYAFDAKRGNLTSRKNHNFNWNESFTYDSLDRLTNISGAVTRKQTYDTRGRIKTNSEVGNYQYAGINYQLKEVDLNNSGDIHYQNNPQQQITYNAYKKPISITAKNNGRVDFEYGILQNRSHAYYGGNDADKNKRRYQKHYSGITPVEIETDKQGNTKIITYIGGDAYSAPVVHVKQTQAGKSNGFHYLHRDYLGSILAITDSAGKVTEQRQFGAWGEVDRFKTGNSEVDFTHERSLLNRGYTGHEHFFEVGLIHMNGRMYDAKLGRFLSPDNFVQEPFSTQNFNRYGYVLNNPLKYNDPSGESFILAIIIGAAISVTTNGISNLINDKPFFKGAGLAAITGAIGGAVSFGIGEAVKGLSGILKVGVQAFMHGHLGGMMSAMMGGEYLSGFAGGAIGSTMAWGADKLLGNASNFWKGAGMIGSGALSGGIGSKLAGGKFWDGFRNGAISSALNHVAHMIQKANQPKDNGFREALDFAEAMHPVEANFDSSNLIADGFRLTWKTPIGIGLVASGQPWLPKRFVTPGSSPGTSVSSKLFGKINLRSPMRLPTIISNSSGTRIAMTRSVGRFLGRWVPYVGWGLTIYDISSALYNSQSLGIQNQTRNEGVRRYNQGTYFRR